MRGVRLLLALKTSVLQEIRRVLARDERRQRQPLPDPLPPMRNVIEGLIGEPRIPRRRADPRGYDVVEDKQPEEVDELVVELFISQRSPTQVA